jgi:hypothetical protein
MMVKVKLKRTENDAVIWIIAQQHRVKVREREREREREVDLVWFGGDFEVKL